MRRSLNDRSCAGEIGGRFVIVQGRYRLWKIWDEQQLRYVAYERSWVDAAHRLSELDAESQARQRGV
jgi:hypothetical protein